MSMEPGPASGGLRRPSLDSLRPTVERHPFPPPRHLYRRGTGALGVGRGPLGDRDTEGRVGERQGSDAGGER